MRRSAFVCLALVLAGGCLPSRQALHSEGPDQNEKSIEITLHNSSTHITWVLYQDRAGIGTIFTGILSPAPPPDYELPPEVFDECRRLLESTRFMDMVTPSNYSAVPVVDISAKYKGRFTTVMITTQTEAPKGFAEVQRFLEGLPARAKRLASADRIEISNSFGSGIYGDDLPKRGKAITSSP